mmetsp:Transcript_8376/g.18785  ORF Transcript_8376/g.18785 Transcript_8376/m.18785 type:complete len:313 (+) Transcript_8376:64-1002(+)
MDDPGSVALSLLTDYDAFLFDCDGTLYQAGTPLPHVKEALQYLRQRGKKLAFVTNTSARSAVQLQEKLQQMGIDCHAEECMPSGAFTAQYIKESHPETRRVYVIGGQGLADEFHRVGIETQGLEDGGKPFEDDEYLNMSAEIEAEQFDGVVVGWDTSVNFYKLARAALIFQKYPNCFFYSTNADVVDRIGDLLLPGNGCIVPAVEAVCANCAPSRVGRPKPFGETALTLGKPSAEFARAVCSRLQVECQRVVMFGDRLDTDIVMARDVGLGSCLVLTGVHGVEQTQEKGIKPNYILPGVGSLWTYRPDRATL